MRAILGNILLDCGALMVGMSNRQVTEYWLSRAPSRFVAAVFFEENKVMIRLRDGHETPLTYSPLKGRLADVLIYLDDIHTRGTDFKFPIPAHGYVTLGRKLPKDKLVQACMRMRNLGHGHSISFLAPREVYFQLQKLSDPPESPHVIHWALENTILYIQNGLLEWASQGLHFSRRVTATEMFQNPNLSHWTESQRFQYFTHLVQLPETLKLSDMYESLQSSAQAISVLRETRNRHVQSLSNAFRNVAASRVGETRVLSQAGHIASAVVVHCDKYFGQMQLKSKCLDEEQEKELEEEEEERQIYRPQHYDPYKPQPPKWIDEVVDHQPVSSISELAPLWEAMKRTRVHSLSSNKDFDPRILTSYNFRRVLK